MKQLILGLILIFSITVSVAQPQIVFDIKITISVHSKKKQVRSLTIFNSSIAGTNP